MRNDPAFSKLETTEEHRECDGYFIHESSSGLTKLEYTAIQLMAAMVSSGIVEAEYAVKKAHDLWDELEKK